MLTRVCRGRREGSARLGQRAAQISKREIIMPKYTKYGGKETWHGFSNVIEH
jgi:hypothetical protein